MSQGAAPAGQLHWVLLDRVPTVVITSRSRSFTDGQRAFNFGFQLPPLRSFLNLKITNCTDPYIAAVEPTGYLLLSATQPSCRQGAQSPAAGHQRAYYLCDGTNGFASPLGRTDVELHQGNVGVIAGPGGKIMVAELRHVVGADRATLYYCSRGEMWKTREVDYSPPGDRPVRPWGGNGVISHNGSLWWIDLTQGLVRCDPFVENPRLVHVPLPPGCELATSAVPEVTKRRCIQVSRGKIRFVQLEGDTNSTVIKSWTLQAGQQPGIVRWKPGFEIPILQVWADQSFRHLAGKLQERVPDLAFINPSKPNVIFFTQNQHLFGVDLMSGKTEVFHQCEKMVRRPDEILVLTLMQKPWTILPSSILLQLQQNYPLGLGNDGIRMWWRGHPPKTTVVYMDANELGNVDAEYCYVSAVDLTSGDFLICAGYKLKKKGARTSNAYFLVDSVPVKTRRLPVLSTTVDKHHGNAGILVSGGTTYVIILQPGSVAGHATLYLWTSAHTDDVWRTRQTSYVPRTSRRQWNGNGVIAHGRRLFLTDLSDGLLMCDLFSFSPRIKLQFIPLPQGCELAEGMAATASDLITKRRCVNVSCGMLRFVHMEDRGPDKPPVVKLWTLNDLPDEITWRHEYTLNFRTIWEHQSFRATGLSRVVPPSVGLIHPWRYDVIYFVQRNTIFSVDTTTGRVSQVSEFQMAALPEDCQSPVIHWHEASADQFFLLPRSCYTIP